ncbi:serine hydrolase domain-containing protein [Gramella sp. AN32]|uniref:Serine hydrolase domain-containing protein n=1 Tax=Christiangramia antarctica TaxID=2058158 RepID=A0ABW5X4S4_9FLAO|nr:serine hydrolase domain-containing protein [Gramella sp. AN32]MCM4155726.1 peptidase [Gramella sp. AN32]
MKNFIITAVLLFLSTICVAQKLNTEKLDSLFQILEQNDKFMGSLAVSQNGNTIYKNTIGFINLEDSIKSNDNTKYRIGSISKIFTATLILKAVEENKLELGQSLNDFYPTVKNSETITIRNLLNHSSGIHDFTRNEDYSNWSKIKQPKDSMLKRIAGYESEFPPHSKSEYSNSNFVLLTYILEDVYKKSFETLLKEKITTPLKLVHTFYGGEINNNNNEASSYSYLGKWNKEPETDMSIPQGAGAIVSTPEDLNIFIAALFAENILSEASLEQMKNIENGYGLGLLRFPYNEKWSYGHTGGIDGFQSVTGFFPEDKLAISLTSNGINYNINEILLAVLGSFYGDGFDLPHFNKVKLSTKDLEKYLGTYSSEQIPPKIMISREGSTLLAQATGQPSFPLEPTAKDIFIFEQAGVEIEFKPHTEEMLMKQGGKEFLFTKE